MVLVTDAKRRMRLFQSGDSNYLIIFIFLPALAQHAFDLRR